MESSITHRLANERDQQVLWNMLAPVIRSGGTYVFALDSSQEKILNYWLGEEKYTYVVEKEGDAVGTFFLKSNHIDLGNHICNAGFVVSPQAQGQGIGKWMGEKAQEEAKKLGYLAMQFNFVIKSNTHAVLLWKSLGFQVIGEIPGAYRHPQLGLMPALIFHKKL